MLGVGVRVSCGCGRGRWIGGYGCDLHLFLLVVGAACCDRGSGCGYGMQLLRLVLGVDALLCREGGGRERLKCSS